MIAGDWMYRSYLNNPDPVSGDPQRALNDIFGEGVFSLATPTPDAVTGTFDMGGGLVLDLRGQISAGAGGVLTVQMAGLGRPGHGRRRVGIRLLRLAGLHVAHWCEPSAEPRWNGAPGQAA